MVSVHETQRPESTSKHTVLDAHQTAAHNVAPLNPVTNALPVLHTHTYTHKHPKKTKKHTHTHTLIHA